MKHTQKTYSENNWFRNTYKLLLYIAIVLAVIDTLGADVFHMSTHWMLPAHILTLMTLLFLTFTMYQANKHAALVESKEVSKKSGDGGFRDQEGVYRLLAENAVDFICALTPQGTYTYASPSIKTILGIDPKVVIGLPAFTRCHPEDADALREAFHSVSAEGKPGTICTRWFHLNGSLVWLEAKGVPLFDSAGEVTQIVIIARDTTEQVRAQRMLVESEQRYKSLFDNNPDSVYALDLNGIYVNVNKASEKFTGHTAQETIGQHFTFNILPADFAYVQRLFNRVLTGNTVDSEVTLRHKLGHSIVTSVVAMPVVVDGETVGVYGIAKDITEIRSSQSRLERQNQVLTMIARNEPLSDALCRIVELAESATPCHSAIYMTDETGGVLSHAASRRLSPQFVAELGDLPVAAGAGSCGTAAHRQEIVAVSDIAESPLWSGHRAIASRYGLRACWSAPLLSAGGKVLGTFSMYSKNPGTPGAREVELLESCARMTGLAIERHDYEAEIHQLVYRDPLTGIANRRLFTRHVEEALTAASTSGLMAAVLLLDLDRFKSINDTFGHQFGDEILHTIATRIQECLPPGVQLSRLGGDEFAVVMANIAEQAQAVSVAQAMLEQFSAPIVANNQEFVITASIGITVSPNDGDNVDVLLRNADTAMYEAKAAGRNAYRVYTAEMNQQFHDRLLMESHLRRAIEKAELYVEYQPRVDAKTHLVVGAEALLRWKNPRFGQVSPRDFISLAEETGLIVSIGDWVLHAVCRQIQAWTSARLPFGRISVNVSGRQLQESDFVEKLTSILRLYEVDTTWIEIGITESTVIFGAEEAIERLKQIRQLGVHVSLDDFGTGYSSLARLQRLPLDALKIDQLFIRNITDDRDNTAIADAIIALGHSLRLRVVAEGVETSAQSDFLQEHQCDEMQGYLFSRPIPAVHLEALLRSPMHLVD